MILQVPNFDLEEDSGSSIDADHQRWLEEDPDNVV
jgi:hypothetical protein